MKYVLAMLALSHPASEYLHSSEVNAMTHSRGDPFLHCRSDESFVEQLRVGDTNMKSHIWVYFCWAFVRTYGPAGWAFSFHASLYMHGVSERSCTPVIQLPEGPFDPLGVKGVAREPRKYLECPRACSSNTQRRVKQELSLFPPNLK